MSRRKWITLADLVSSDQASARRTAMEEMVRKQCELWGWDYAAVKWVVTPLAAGTQIYADLRPAIRRSEETARA